MNFEPNHYFSSTVAAIATPLGYGGVAIVRISGVDAIAMANTVIKADITKASSHLLKRSKIIDCKGDVIDDVLYTVMRSPKTFTGEDVVEIHCHGGYIIPSQILNLLFRAGAKPASPGEFSKRAYLNGKLDLAQAEAIQQMIHASSEQACQFAKDQLMGKLSEKIRLFQKKLTDITAIIEAWVDYPEEGLEFASKEEIISRLHSIEKQMSLLVNTFQHGKKITNGLKICLLGAPNVGKSSLLNALLNMERAIVTPIAGTTRDLIEETFMLDELAFSLVDTAGIRHTEEIIEQEGIKRSKQQAKAADIVLYVLDTTQVITQEHYQLIDELDLDKTIIIWNKMDEAPAPREPAFAQSISISAKQQLGLETLKNLIKEKAYSNMKLGSSEVHLTQQRHFTTLSDALACLSQAIDGLQSDISPEFLSCDLKQTLQHLAKIIGTDVTEDILSSIFANFCVGK